MSSTEQVSVLLQRGIAAIKAGQKQQAHQILLKVIELDEHNEQAWLWMSQVVESLEDKRLCLENVLTLNPDNAHAQAGLRWLEQQSPAPPVAPASPVASASPDALASPGALVSTDMQDRCPHCGKEVPASGTTCPHCQQPLIIACPACGQYVDVSRSACPDCGLHWGDFREGARYHLALAQAYLDQGKLDLAQPAAARAEAAYADDPQALASVAALYEAMERPDLAVAVYQRAIKGDPGNVELYLRLGTVYQVTARFDQARTMYRKARQLDAHNPTVYYKLARLRIQESGATPKAIELLQQALQLDPGHVPTHLLLGDVYFKQQKLEQARQHYEQVYQLAAPDSDIGQQARNKLVQAERLLQTQDRGGQVSPGQRARPRGRPGCVTLYAVLSGIGGACSVVSVLSLLGSDPSAMVGAMPTLVFAVCSLAIAFGLWSLQNWARIMVIVMTVITMLWSLVQFVLAKNAANDMMSAYPELQEASSAMNDVFAFIAAPIVLINGYIIFWFWTNRDVFEG